MAGLNWFHVRGRGYVQIVQFGSQRKSLFRRFNDAVCAGDARQAMETASVELTRAAESAGYQVCGFHWEQRPQCDLLGTVRL